MNNTKTINKLKNMKKFLLSLLLMTVAILVNAQTIVKGDMNNDGQATIADVTSLVNVVLGKTPMETVNASTSPFTVDNSYVAGTWYASDGTHFTLGDDGTTDFPGGSTYRFYLGQNRLLILNSSERAVLVIPIVEATSSYLLTVDYATGVPTYYTKSTSLATGISISPSPVSMNSGSTQQLTATLSPAGAFGSVAWTSSDESVATVDQNGLVTAVAGGTAIITATAGGSLKTATCTVTVTQMVTSITLSQTTVVLELDEFERLTATVLPENAVNKSVVWSSSNPDIAPVRNGRVDAYDYGTVVITCTAADGSGTIATCTIMIVEDKSGIGAQDGHFYVDLGLPSGTLWAMCNIGAENPEDYGDYFAWGETTGYNSGKTDFSWSTYKYCNGSGETLTKYNGNSGYGTVDNKTELELTDDAAYMNWGSNWRMPSREQFEELINSSYTTTEWTTQNGKNGYKITSKSNGKSIFLPAAGLRSGTSLYGGSGGNYWSRTLYASSPNLARILYFFSSSIYMHYYYYHYYGHTVRPVRVSQ